MKLLQNSLLEKFIQIREDVANTTDLQLKKEKLNAASMEICARFHGTIASNFEELLKDRLESVHYDIDILINFLEKDIQSPFDQDTIRREQEDAFDRKYGSQTSTIISQIELPEFVSNDRMQYSARYHPSPVRIVEKAFNELANYQVEYKDWTFIDIGAGLGRNLLLASSYGFERIIGIEISAYLCQQAKENIKKYNAIENIPCKAEIINQDILTYQFPAGNLVLYFWDPFQDKIQDEFVKNLEHYVSESRYRTILIFLGPVFKGIISSNLFEPLGGFVFTSENTTGLGVSFFQNI